MVENCAFVLLISVSQKFDKLIDRYDYSKPDYFVDFFSYDLMHFNFNHYFTDHYYHYSLYQLFKLPYTEKEIQEIQIINIDQPQRRIDFNWQNDSRLLRFIKEISSTYRGFLLSFFAGIDSTKQSQENRNIFWPHIIYWFVNYWQHFNVCSVGNW